MSNAASQSAAARVASLLHSTVRIPESYCHVGQDRPYIDAIGVVVADGGGRDVWVVFADAKFFGCDRRAVMRRNCIVIDA